MQQQNRHGSNNKNNYQNSNNGNSNNNNNSSGSHQHSNKGVNLQVYRVDNIIADNPQAIKDALTQVAPVPPNKTRVNGLSGIDLSNHKGVVIIDYIPDGDVGGVNNSTATSANATSAANVDGEFNNSGDDENENDGFLQVMTKKGKKAEKLKAQQAAAAAAAAAQAALINNAKAAHINSKKASNFSSNNKKDSNNNLLATKTATKQPQTSIAPHQKPNQKSNDLINESTSKNLNKTDKAIISTNSTTTTNNTNTTSATLPLSTSPTSSDVTLNLNKTNNGSIMTNIQTWKNEMASPEAASSNSPGGGSVNKQGLNQHFCFLSLFHLHDNLEFI